MVQKSSPAVQRIGIGIDTARYGHRVCFLRDDLQNATPPLTVLESRAGYLRLEQQLRKLQEKFPQAEYHVRIDAAGQYAANLESFLRRLDLPLSISVGEPKRNKDYHHAHSPKRQTDDTESWAMARYAVIERPAPSPSTGPEFVALRRVASRLQAQTKQTTRLTNQLHELLSAVFPELATLFSNIAVLWLLRVLDQYPSAARLAAARRETLAALPFVGAEKAEKLHTAARASVAHLSGAVAEGLVRQLVRQLRDSLTAEEQWKKLLEQAFDALPDGPHRQIATIKGIGKLTAAAIVATAVSIDRFATANDLVGYYGVFPCEATSGVDKFGQPIPPGKKFMCTKGNDLVRGLLWNCAKSAAHCNPAVRALYDRLIERGVRGDVAFGYCMTKLLRLVFAIWKTGKPFDPQHYPWEPAAAPLDDELPDEQLDAVASPTEPVAEPVVAAATPVPPADRSTTKKAVGLNEQHGSEYQEVTTADSSLIAAPVETKLPPTASASPTISPAAAAPLVPSLGSAPSTVANPAAVRQLIDFRALRSVLSLEQILRHLGCRDPLRRSSGSSTQYRGPCPLHDAAASSRTFSVNLAKNVFQCFDAQCGQKGNALEFWAAYHGQTLAEAARSVCVALGLPLPLLAEPATERPAT